MFWDEKEIRKEKLRKRNRRRAQRGLEPTRGRLGRWILNILLFLLACGFIYGAYRLYLVYTVYHHNSELKAEMQQTLYTAAGTEDFAEIVTGQAQEEKIDLIGALQKVNPRIRGWIHIEDTSIDYPVVQGSDNSFYLDHNVYDEETICGSIFMNAGNTLDAPMENLILYGHRMRDDSMFGHLSKYLDSLFFAEHPTFTLILPDGSYTCEIFAVYQTTTYGFAYNKIHPGDTEESFLEYVEQCKAHSLYETKTKITGEDRIITLSTCDSALDAEEGRLVVQAKLVKNDAGE